MNYVSNSILACGVAIASTMAASAQTSSRSIECGQTYTVAPGDTLSRISSRAYGSIPFTILYEQNKAQIGPNPDKIIVGQTLQIPCLTAQGTPVAPADAPAGGAETVQEEVAVQEEVTPEEEVAVQEDATPQEDVATQSDTVILTFNKTSAPPFIINSGIIDPYLAEIAEVTDGRVQFVDPDTISRDHSEQFDLVTSGAVDAAYVLNSNIAQSHPLLQLPALPLMGGSAEQTAVSLWRLHEAYLSQTDYFEEAQLLGFVSAPAAHIWREESAPVAADEDVADKNVYPVPYFEGLDIRGPQALQAEVAEFLVEYNAQNDEPPTFFLAHGAARALGIWSDTLLVTEVNYGMYTPVFSVILSNEAWARISEADQQAILEVSGEKLSHRSASWDAFDNGFRSDMLDTGLKFVKADADLLRYLRESSRGAIRSWMSEANSLGIPASAALEFYQDSLRSLEDRLLFR